MGAAMSLRVLVLAALIALTGAVVGAWTASGGDPAAPSGDTTGAPPPADSVLPTDPGLLAERMTAADRSLRRAISAWRTAGAPERGEPPEEVTLQALYLQRALRALSRRPDMAARTIRRLSGRLAHTAREVIASLRDLRRLSAGWKPHRVRTQAPEPIGVLLGHYRKAQRRFGVGWHVLAAVNFVESAFGRLRNDSVAGARGPMQFIPATWRAYGLGGDVHDPHDAILGAAHYLRRSGAPADYGRALYAYNPSRLYVAAVRRYARLIARDRDAVYAIYSWQVFVRTRTGERRLTGP